LPGGYVKGFPDQVIRHHIVEVGSGGGSIAWARPPEPLALNQPWTDANLVLAASPRALSRRRVEARHPRRRARRSNALPPRWAIAARWPDRDGGRILTLATVTMAGRHQADNGRARNPIRANTFCSAMAAASLHASALARELSDPTVIFPA